jgi:hypothetical protein
MAELIPMPFIGGRGENTIFLFFSSSWPENPFSSFVIAFQVIF